MSASSFPVVLMNGTCTSSRRDYPCLRVALPMYLLGLHTSRHQFPRGGAGDFALFKPIPFLINPIVPNTLSFDLILLGRVDD